MPSATDPPEARAEIDRRAVSRTVRAAALNCYGVIAVTGARWYSRLAARLGLGGSGVVVDADGDLVVAVNLEIAPSVPHDQVLANVRDAISYAVQRDVGRPIDRLTLTVDGR